MNLEEEIKRKEEELFDLKERLKNTIPTDIIKPINEFSYDEKVIKFDHMYNYVIDTINRIKEDGYKSDDDEHYAWEMLMEFMVKEGQAVNFWKWYNKICN
jgi:hypothetical protein